MAFRSYRRLSAKAVWSRKIIFISLQLLLLTIFLHRFMDLHTPAALVIMGICFVAAAGALLVSLWALKQIWDRGYAGAGRALLSITLACLMLAGPAYLLPKYVTLPQINDITTDFSAPPNFEALAQNRSVWANSIIYPGDAFAQKQKTAYPHIKPMILERSAREAYDLVRDAVRRLDWRVIKLHPGKDGASGWIEATDKTMIMGFVDDVVVRVSGDDAGARIDVRSASRFGRHDFGGNANRISTLFDEIRTTLAKGEQQLKLQKEIAARRAQKLKEAEKRRKRKAAELARKKREARRAQEQEKRYYTSDAPPSQNTEESDLPAKPVKRKKRRKRYRPRPLGNSDWDRLFNDR